MAATLFAHERKVAQIFSDEYEFNIPSYQRPYAWTNQQAGELLEDLLSFMRGQKGDVAQMSPYFLGSLVLIKSEAAPRSDVVDGQQRLTTLTLLLSAIRSLVSPARAQEITYLIYQAGNIIAGNTERFRLMLRPRDREFFQVMVQRSDGFDKLITSEGQLSDSQSKLRSNGKLFHSALSKVENTELLNLAQFIATRCFLVVVSTPDLDSAYRIFSVMNSRGLDLAATDILKAEIIGEIPSTERDYYTNKWETIEEDLGREEFDNLFGHIRMIYRKAKPQGTLLREFQEHVCKKQGPKDTIKNIIIPYAAKYRDIIGCDYGGITNSSNINRNLEWLDRIEFSDWIPPALAFTASHYQNAPFASQFFRDLERLAYCMLVCRWGVNDRIERFSKLTRDIEEGNDLVDDSSSLQLSSEERNEFLSILDGPLYESLSARARSSVLLRLDDLVSGGGATYDHAIVSVEHVLPQNPANGSEWLKWFPLERDRQLWTHRMGNLALLTRKKNSAASNYEFSKKKNIYFTKDGACPFPLTTQVIQHQSWTPTIIKDRQNYLINKCKSFWRL